MKLKAFVVYFSCCLDSSFFISSYDSYADAVTAKNNFCSGCTGLSDCCTSSIFDRDIFLRYGVQHSSLVSGSPLAKKALSILHQD